jgi:hypothetical protein
MGRFPMLFAIALVTACSSTPASPGTGEPLPVTRLRSEPFSYAYSTGLVTPQEIVVRSPAQWKAVWTDIWRNHSTHPALPDIDFAQEIVVVAALGERPTGGYSIFIDAASSESDGIAVRIRSVSPANGCGVTLALTQPVDIARIPRREGRVRFEEKQEVQDCR